MFCFEFCFFQQVAMFVTALAFVIYFFSMAYFKTYLKTFFVKVFKKYIFLIVFHSLSLSTFFLF